MLQALELLLEVLDFTFLVIHLLLHVRHLLVHRPMLLIQPIQCPQRIVVRRLLGSPTPPP